MPRFRKYGKKKSSKGGFRKAVAKVIRSVMPRPEIKHYNASVSDGSVDITGVITQMIQMAEGTVINARIGNDINVSSLNATILLTNDSAASGTGAPVFLRVMIVQDSQQNAAAPTIAQVLANVNVQSTLNPDFVGRFKIWYDWSGALNSQSNAVTAGAPVVMKKLLKFHRKIYGKHRKVEFTAAGGGDVCNNHFYIIYLTDTDEVGNISTIWDFSYTDS